MLARVVALVLIAACSEPATMAPDATPPMECTTIPMCRDIGCPTAGRLVDEQCFAHIAPGEVAFCQCAAFSPTTGPWCIWQ